ncbi:MAG: YegS/Rv2252/BmrU family lipid kinase, partial [Clostridia bacterium]|nr:YegS/Rv2252/BmrU family lipid kinase [Clostridia bacterium]
MFDLIFNPSAKGGKAAKLKKRIEEILERRGVEFKIHDTSEPKDATRIARELTESGAENIVAVGGDGTIHEVLNGIDCEKVNLGIIPLGSGNDFIAAAGIPLDLEKSIDVLLSSSPKPTDYMVCDGIKGINIIGTGIDVDILVRCRKSKLLRGKLQYVWSLIISLIKFKFYKFGIRNQNGEREDKEALIACVGNGSQFGGGIKMCPGAIIDDGKLDFVIAGKLKKIRIPFAFVKLLKGKILEQDFTSKEYVENVKIDFDSPVTIQID